MNIRHLFLILVAALSCITPCTPTPYYYQKHQNKPLKPTEAICVLGCIAGLYYCIAKGVIAASTYLKLYERFHAEHGIYLTTRYSYASLEQHKTMSQETLEAIITQEAYRNSIGSSSPLVDYIFQLKKDIATLHTSLKTIIWEIGRIETDLALNKNKKNLFAEQPACINPFQQAWELVTISAKPCERMFLHPFYDLKQEIETYCATLEQLQLIILAMTEYQEETR